VPGGIRGKKSGDIGGKLLSKVICGVLSPVMNHRSYSTPCSENGTNLLNERQKWRTTQLMELQSLLSMFRCQNIPELHWQDGPSQPGFFALENPHSGDHGDRVEVWAPSREGVMKEDVITKISGDRRNRRRYDIDLPVQYKARHSPQVSWTGSGRTINVSGGGIACEVNEVLPPGSAIELSIAWPVLLDGTCRLKLVATGKVVRSYRNFAAVRMERYEFHTQAPYGAKARVAGSGFLD
jgi:hypothetical protein